MKTLHCAVLAATAAALLTACPSAADTTQPTITTFTGNAAQLELAASDAGGIQRVEFYRVSARKKSQSLATEQPTAPDLPSGDLLVTDTAAPYAYTFTARDNGSFSYFAIAYDLAGNSAQSQTTTVTVNIADTTPPAVPVLTLNKTSFNEGETLTATVTASDDVGVDRVEFVLEGFGTQSSDSSAPYEFGQTTTCADPNAEAAPARDPASVSKTYRAVAVDIAGNSTSSVAQTVTITCNSSTVVK
jgi:hypothetical protein